MMNKTISFYLKRLTLGACCIGFCAVPQANAANFSASASCFKYVADHISAADLQIIKISDTEDQKEIDKIGTGASNFIDNMAKRALKFLADPELTEDKKKEEFGKLLTDSFDMRTIGRFALGRYWRVSTPPQQEEYVDLFENMVIDVYSSRFGEYSGQKFKTNGFRHAGKSDYIVNSSVIDSSGGSEIQVDWRVRYKKSKYQIVDVVVEGVSMSLTQRSDFAAVIQRGGGNVEVLLDHLREKKAI